MNPETPKDAGKNPGDIPEGVPGERDTSFERYNDALHEQLKAWAHTDDPSVLKKTFSGSAREDLIKKFGHPDEVIVRTSESVPIVRRAKADYIRVLQQIRILQADWNRTVSSIRDLEIKKTALGQVLIETENQNPLLHPIKQLRRLRALEEINRIDAILRMARELLEERREAFRKMGFKALTGEELYTETAFNNHA